MTEVTVREFSYNPSAMFARVQRGESLEVTRHGDVVAMLVPPPRGNDPYENLLARGVVKPRPATVAKANDWESFVHLDVDDDVDPLEILAQQRADRDITELSDEGLD